ncbi:MAG: hypothetical protein AAFY17_09975 [Cyanobacteria bacterium J06642_11]
MPINLPRLGCLLGLIAIISWGTAPPVAMAAPLCRTIDNHQVCILKITRSAKYYWEYRAIVKIDDKQRPMGRYNCRTRKYLRRDGETIDGDPGTQVICSLFKQ